MLYHLFTTYFNAGAFRVFRYASFRIPAAALTALILTLFLTPRCSRWLSLWQHGHSNVREDTPAQHQKKQGTPTMGGVCILFVVVLTSLLWADLSNALVWVLLFVTMGFGLVGLVDDWRKITGRNSKGLSARQKLLWQTLVLLSLMPFLALLRQLGLTLQPLFDTHLSFPLVSVRWFWPDLAYWYWPFAWLVVVGTAHAVNLTDGLDGLAIGPTIVSAATFLVFSYAAGLVLSFNQHGQWVDFNVAEYLNIPHIDGGSELAVVCASMVAAGIGFLWFNTHPASIFMGDVGSLGLGGALGSLAVLTKHEVSSAILHGVFLAEALSVIVQVLSFKWRKKRVFRMAPLHHHFELLGWPEPKIIVRFWIIAVCLALVCLVLLKLR